MSWSTFTRRALAAALERLRAQAREQRHREGYRRKAVRRGEFDTWHAEPAWPG